MYVFIYIYIHGMYTYLTQKRKREGEKGRARQDYYNERRKANARLKAFSKEDALQIIRKNFKQSPKY